MCSCCGVGVVGDCVVVLFVGGVFGVEYFFDDCCGGYDGCVGSGVVDLFDGCGWRSIDVGGCF